MMWLKICYVLKNNKDKLLGYIHIPTKQDHFNEEIRWVQARQNDRRKERLRCVTPELDATECLSPSLEEDFHYDIGETLSYEEIDDMPCVHADEQHVTEQIHSPTEEDDDIRRKEFSVEIRYQPRAGELGRSGFMRSTSPMDVSPKTGREESSSRHDSDDEETRCAHLEQISFDNKMRFIYSQGEDGNEEVLRIPTRQEEFNRGICHYSSSPKKDKSASPRKTTPRSDATFTTPSNSSDLKEMIYHQWLEKKKVQTKIEIKAKMLATKKASKQAETEANDRKVSARKIYDAWNDSKTGQILSEKDMKEKVKQAQKEKMEESLQRKKESEKYFATWKREKDDSIKKLHSQKKKEEKQKDKESFKMKRQSSEEALKAFESWKSQKTKESTETKKREETEKAKHGEEKLMAFEKKQEALRVYEQWKSSVKKSPRAQSPQLTQRSWLPTGRNLNNSIPEEVQPVIMRNRNVSH